MMASKALADFAGHVQNRLTLSAMTARLQGRPSKLTPRVLDPLSTDPTAVWTCAVALMAALAVWVALASPLAQPISLGLLAVLAACGLFFVLAMASGRIVIARRGGARSNDLIADVWPEGTLITGSAGETFYDNEAFCDIVGPTGQQGLAGLEALCSGNARSAPALFRLVRAGERAEERSEEIETRPTSTASSRTLEISVSPIAAGRLAPLALVLWRVKDVTAERNSELAAGEASARFAAYDETPLGLVVVRSDTTIAHVNTALTQMIGPHGGRADSDVVLETLFAKPGVDVLRRQIERATTTSFECVLELATRPHRSVRVWADAPPLAAGQDGLDRVLVVTPLAAASMAASGLADVQLPGDPGFARQFESAPFGIATVTASGQIVRANATFAMLVMGNYQPLVDRAADVLGSLVDAEQRAALDALLSDALAGQTGSPPVDFVAGTKGEYGRRVYATPLSPVPGGREAAIVYLVDTTEQKALEAKFAQSQKMEAIGNLAGGIAHDFNNVLTAIIGSADLMLQTHRATDAAHKDIQNIKQSANRAAALVGQLMAFSRRQTLKLEVLQPSDVMTDLRPILKTMLGETIDVQIKTGRDLWYVKADRTQIDQVLLNFAANARHAMPNGGLFMISTSNVTEREAQKLPYTGLEVAEYVLIQVEDTGTGMPAEVLAKIFEPFFTTKEVGKGTGLGLSTVYGIIKQFSGYIFTESTVGAGTTFKIFLPRAHPSPAVEPVASKPARKDLTPADLTGTATVLVVEDEDMVRSVAVRSLTRFGYKVVEAGNGLEALDVLAAHPGLVDVVVSDVVMPEMDGPALLKEVRKTRPNLKFIFVSGHTNEAFRATVDENEVFAFLPKPFSLPQLLAKVKEELAR